MQYYKILLANVIAQFDVTSCVISIANKVEYLDKEELRSYVVILSGLL